MVTLHSNTLLSSIKPAENPLKGALQRSVNNIYAFVKPRNANPQKKYDQNQYNKLKRMSRVGIWY